MSKDKGSKNHKKAPADKDAAKKKAVSEYKTEGKSKESPTLEPFNAKTQNKESKKS